jgi:cytochrome c oxidase cbb3-type subunit 4
MDFDVNTLRIAATVLSFFVFIGILVWAYSRRNRDRFEEDARIPFSHEQ